jgi:predicted transcriptional regulator
MTNQMSAEPKPRRDENTTMTISLPKSLKARLEEAAAEDRRKVSPWVVLQLESVLDAMQAGQSSADGMAERPAVAPRRAAGGN